MISSVAIVSSITAIAIDVNNNTLYISSGGQLTAYLNIGINKIHIPVLKIGPIDIFNINTIHRIKCFNNSRLNTTVDTSSGIELIIEEEKCMSSCIVFGGKGIAIVKQNKYIPTNLIKEIIYEDLDDLVLDSILIDNMLMIGFAHNFVDIIVITPQIPPTKSICTCLYRVQCPDISALFSLSMTEISNKKYDSLSKESSDSKVIEISSGTAFGKIILWHFTVAVDIVPVVVIDKTLSGHEGQCFLL